MGWAQHELDALDGAAQQEIETACRRAEEAPDADLASVFTSVFAS
jgi:TPP-dependent pyruvate/acetoin dehydrogenase alpha subunit